MLSADPRPTRGRGVLGWAIALLLAGAGLALLVHVPDDGPHIFETISTTTSTTTEESTVTTAPALIPSTTTSTAVDQSTTTTTTAGATSTTTPGPALANNDLVGNTFLVQSATMNGDDYAITSRITLTFSQDGNQQRAYWDDGCNSASAPVVIRASTIEVGPITATTAGCPSNQQPDTYFLTPLLRANPKWSKDGSTVVFEGAGRRVVTTAL